MLGTLTSDLYAFTTSLTVTLVARPYLLGYLLRGQDTRLLEEVGHLAVS